MNILYNIKKKNSPLNILKRIFKHLNNVRKKQIAIVIFLSLVTSLSESISVALLIPFLNLFINPELYLSSELLNKVFLILNLDNKKEIQTIISLIFILTILIAGLIRIIFLNISNKLTDNITSDFRIKIFNFFLNQDYSYYYKYGSRNILSNLAQKAGAFNFLIFASINIFNAILISLFIIFILIYNEPVLTPIIIISVIIFYLTIYKFKSFSVNSGGEKISKNQNKIIDIFENVVGYLPEIIIYNIKDFFSFIFKKASEETASATAQIRTVAQTPRIYLETFILILVICLVTFLNLDNRELQKNLVFFGILAFSAQKILPLINSIYNLSINFKGGAPAALNFLEILDIKTISKRLIKEDNKSLSFDKNIQIKNLSFSYNEGGNKVLDNFNCEILKGSKLLVKGKTGSGKSTLVNILTGLLDPNEGHISIDGTIINQLNKLYWQKNISIVPQVIFLNDATILENIAIGLGVAEIDLNKAKECAFKAHISNFIEKLPNTYFERVGEKGIRLSGGQKQRLGIARALYRDTKLIILDEPTNALDKDTEKSIVKSILSLDKSITLIMITHSDDLEGYFDKVIDLDNQN